MLKREVTYENYDGVEVKETFYFNLTRSEIIMMGMEEDGDVAERLQAILDKKDGKQIVKTFHDLLLRSYGEKSADGRRFVKSAELSKAFSETPAFDVIFEEMMTNPDKALDFINGLIPKQYREAVQTA